MTAALLQRPAMRIAFIGVLLAGGIVLMRLIYKVRIEELGQNLEAAADKTMALRSLGLIARYQLIQSRMKQGETIALLRKETSVSFAGTDSLAADKRETAPVAYELGLSIVNVVNRIAGARLVGSQRKSRAELLMEEAYLLELQRNFAAAVPVYDRLIGEIQERDHNLASFARLHRGYCLSFAEDRARAADDYRAVIRSNNSGEYRITAEVLLAYLEEFSMRAERIAKMPQSVEKGSAYFDAGAYSSAIATLEALPSAKKTSKSSYLLGRSYEEIGRAEKALEKYRSLISAKPDSEFAKLANRRIYALGSVYASGKDLVAESATNAKQTLADTELIKEQKRTQPLSAALTQKREELRSRIEQEKAILPQAELAPAQPAARPDQPVAIATAPDRALPKPRRPKPKIAAVRAKAEPDEERILTRSERKAIIEREARIDELVLSDGNRLWGIILKESNDDISMLTVMGKMQIEKKQIVTRAKVDSPQAFKQR